MRLEVESGDTVEDVVCVELPGGAGWFTEELAFDVKGDQVVFIGLGSGIRSDRSPERPVPGNRACRADR